jgi:hypothetical protein
MLGLPSGTLRWKLTNRSLTAIEAELFRHVNADLRDRGADWSTFYKLDRKGAIRLGPERRKVSTDEPRVLLPPWAAQIADKDGRRFADSIRRCQVRIVGDLEKLAADSPTAEWHDMDSVPIDIAANGVVGAVSAAQQSADGFRQKTDSQAAEIARLNEELAKERSPTLKQYAGSIAPNQRANQIASAFTARELATAVKRRLVNKLGMHRTRSKRKHSA